MTYRGIGHAEMAICKITNLRRRERVATSVEEQSEEHIRQAAARARGVVAKKCRAIGCERMMTLTTRELITDLDRWWHMWRMFLQRCKRAGLDFRYVAVPELQRRGAWHLHVAVDRFIPHALVLSHWLAICGSGSVNLKRFKAWDAMRSGDRCVAVSGYISKYIGKDMGAKAFGRKRYRCSAGIELERDVIEVERQFTASPLHLAKLFEQEAGLLPRSLRINDHGGRWVASWGDTFPDLEEVPDGQ